MPHGGANGVPKELGQRSVLAREGEVVEKFFPFRLEVEKRPWMEAIEKDKARNLQNTAFGRDRGQ